MKKIVNLSSESGFGLIQVLATTMIVSIAILGLFMSIEYARRQADLNYHTRRSLLYAQGKLDEIKYSNRNLGTYGRPSISNSTSMLNIDERDDRNVMATVKIESSTGGNPYSVTGLLQTYRDEITVEVIWEEYKTADFGNTVPREQSILLKEDYYWKRSQVTPS